MSEVQKSVKNVIDILHDGHEGFATIGKHISDPAAKTFFLEESLKRAKLENELKYAAGIPQEEGGSAAGAVHRAWGELKAHLGSGDHSVLATAEQGEDAAKKAYEEALADDDVKGPIRQVLERQQSEIKSSHDKVKALRDSHQ